MVYYLGAAEKAEVETLYTPSTEAEVLKLSANTYSAMRVSFCNKLDCYAMAVGLDTSNIIDGVCLDEPIGGGYNSPLSVTGATVCQRIATASSQL